MSELRNEGLSAPRELSDAELMTVHGGGIFGDAWDWVKDKVSDGVNAIEHAVTHPIETLGKVVNAIGWIGRQLAKPPPRYPAGGN